MDTFIVRVWTPADSTSADTVLRGVVRHVASGVERPFRCDAQLLGIIRRATDHGEPHPYAGGIVSRPD